MKKILFLFILLALNINSYSQWIESSRPSPAFPLFSFSFPSANTGFAVGYGNTMIKSTNGGVNWFNISFFNTTANDLRSVFFINENTGWMCSTSDTVFYTTNSGSSWAPQISFVSDANQVYFTNSSTGWILSTPNLFRTTNAGVNWTKINTQMGYDFYFFGENTGWRTLYSGGSSSIQKTTNGGVNWMTKHTTSNFRVIYSIDFVNENTGWAGGYREHILKTTDAGDSWIQQRDMDNSAGFYSMDFINENTGWAIGDAGLSVYTINGGSVWNQVPLNPGRAQIKFINSNTGWIVGSKIYKTNTTGLIYKNLSCNTLIEGFYNDKSNTINSDSVRIYLRNGNAPYSMKDSAISLMNSDGSGTYNFLNAANGENYYLVIKHRNSLETWSSSTQIFIANNLNYDFTVSSTQAFGSNQILIDSSPVSFAVYSGDVNQDGAIDLSDASLIDNDAFNYLSGYLPADVNGDEIVDVSDAVFADNNGFNFVGKVTP